MDKDEMDAIEEIVGRYNAILYSNEYRVGTKMMEFGHLVKKGKILTIFKKIAIHNKIKKYEIYETPRFNIQNIPVVGKKIVIYSCIVGNYDTIWEPIFKNSNCDYVLFTDNDALKSTKWHIKKIPQDILKKYDNNGSIINRYYKLNPHILFPDYDYAIYVDGNVQIVSDLSTLIHSLGPLGITLHKHRYRNCIYSEFAACKILKKGNLTKLQEQVEKYNRENFPHQYGMAECGLIVTDLKNKQAEEILAEWFNEFINTSSLRDQISLPYILWRKNITMEQITTLGNNFFQNPKIIVHKNHNSKK